MTQEEQLISKLYEKTNELVAAINQKDRFIAELQRTIDKQAKNLDKADSWYKYFQKYPNLEFTGAEIVAIMRENALSGQ